MTPERARELMLAARCTDGRSIRDADWEELTRVAVLGAQADVDTRVVELRRELQDAASLYMTIAEHGQRVAKSTSDLVDLALSMSRSTLVIASRFGVRFELPAGWEWFATSSAGLYLFGPGMDRACASDASAFISHEPERIGQGVFVRYVVWPHADRRAAAGVSGFAKSQEEARHMAWSLLAYKEGQEPGKWLPIAEEKKD